MNLAELKKAVDDAIEKAKEANVEPIEDIIVSLQIDIADEESIYSNEEVELHYDNNGCASGCVLVAFIEKKPVTRIEEVRR